MIEIERDVSRGAYELFDENNAESLIVTEKDDDPLEIEHWQGRKDKLYKIVVMRAMEAGVPRNKIIIADCLLKELATKRGWIK